jgi:prolipoprotein diacylglyceryltransferase
LFMLALYGLLTALRSRMAQPGALFRILMLGYFSFRFLVEFIRVEGPSFLGLTQFQWISLGVLVWYGQDWLRNFNPHAVRTTAKG